MGFEMEEKEVADERELTFFWFSLHWHPGDIMEYFVIRTWKQNALLSCASFVRNHYSKEEINKSFKTLPFGTPLH
ncbi:hypothetical protein XELAEV_18013578mg [Xenopus laevis]|uniref:Uncharacterized protein n=1 Tax=Xenopus laevis TaxID=8355 RepID=A0A974DQW6_XENLA|nr:hypothetical protein XELAEV_18013578mg [Xenopus laevis]